MYSSDGRTARAQNLACRWFDSFYIHIFSKLIRLDHDILSLNFDYSANVKLLQVWVGEEAVLKTVEVENLCRFESCLQRHGCLAQLVEHTPDKGAVGGSNPPISTKNIKAQFIENHCIFQRRRFDSFLDNSVEEYL